MSVRIQIVRDGGNPQQPSAIEQPSANRLRVRPYSEDGDANYKFALNIRLVNHGTESEPVALEVDWADEHYMEARRFLYVGSGDHWRLTPTVLSGSVSTANLLLSPGECSVGLSPAYGLGEYEPWATGTSAAAYRRRVAGHSNEGREIHAYELGAGARRILVTGRYHPYETASSFCLEGMMDWLARPGAEQEALLAGHTFTFVPLPNPDGVHQGLCKRTAVGGVDLSHEGALGLDATNRTLLGVIDDVRPQGFLDVHGWMYLEQDGLHFLDAGLGDRFAAHLDKHPLFVGNKWKGTSGDDQAAGSIRARAHRLHGSAPLAVSYRWPGRTVPQMRAMGGPTLAAFCRTLAAT